MAARKSTTADRLSAYRAKRSPDRTPEPFGSASSAGGRLFVVQQHSARNLHYDLRLEMHGVLVSWAVPKGPSPNPADKRLAMHVEDHPVEYGEFEGIIPDGNYGAGSVIIWDKGVWLPLEDPERGMEKGKLLFELRGYKLRGRWTLVKTRQEPNSWLFIKERDAYATENGTESLPADSIYSGLTVEELKQPEQRTSEIVEQLKGAGAERRTVQAKSVKVMLAETRPKPFTKDGWVFELKYDGYRLIAGREDGDSVLYSRAGNDLTETFPEIARAVKALPYDGVIIDGEAVVHDEQGLPSFQRLQKRGRLNRRMDIQQAALDYPATLYAFDLLAFEGYDLRPLPLAERKRMLREILPTAGPIRYSDDVEREGEAMYRQVIKLRLEGMVAKKADEPYRGGRSQHWLKIRADRTEDFVVVGYTEPKGSRGSFGALHVAQYDGDELVYAGRVGTGFSGSELDSTYELLQGLEQDNAPCSGELPKGKEHHWIAPELVAEIRFKEITEVGFLRHPVFLRFRDDKPPRECRAEESEETLTEPVQVTDHSVERVVPFSNLDKIFWPDEPYTKGDLIEYYRAVSRWILPYLLDRPLVLTRYPDGIEGKSFYQKDAPGFAPEWIRTIRVWSEGSERELDYFICEDEESLLYIANLASIPLHIWSSRVAAIERPDWCILDLDPKDAPFSDVIKIALVTHELCEEIQLPNYIKTSGSSGLHVLLPLGRQWTYAQSRTLGELLARVIVAECPDIATITRHVSKREGKVYVDFMQNGHGRLLVAPFSVRPKPAAPVSTPLDWDEVTPSLTMTDYTIKTVPRRLAAMKRDPLVEVIDRCADLALSLELLTRKLA